MTTPRDRSLAGYLILSAVAEGALIAAHLRGMNTDLTRTAVWLWPVVSVAFANSVRPNRKLLEIEQHAYEQEHRRWAEMFDARQATEVQRNLRQLERMAPYFIAVAVLCLGLLACLGPLR